MGIVTYTYSVIYTKMIAMMLSRIVMHLPVQTANRLKKSHNFLGESLLRNTLCIKGKDQDIDTARHTVHVYITLVASEL